MTRRIPFALMLITIGSVVYAQPGDFDQDGIWDCNDIDALTAEVAAGGANLSFDLNGDGTIDVADVDEWLAIGGAQNLAPGAAYLYGDMNLDGSVDVSDHMIWNGNKLTVNSNWCDGNVSLDGVVDIRDFNVWNDNKFLSSGALLDDSADPSPLDNAVDFHYDAVSGLMTIDPNGLDISCFSVFGAEPLSFMLNGAGDFDPTQPYWVQDFFLGHSKWFSLDVSAVDSATGIAMFESGLTESDFDYVSFGIPDGTMGRGSVTIVNGFQVVPEPTAWVLLLALLPLCWRRKGLAC